ncbi:MAG: PAS domain S-box protein [Solirubrobacterales bacterium]|jgi:PAS domain S-box-containing protein
MTNRARDRPDRKRAAVAIPPSENPYRAFLALSGDGIARLELDEPLDVAAAENQQVDHILRNSRVAECNEPFAKVYGRTAADLAGQRLADFFPSDDPARVQGILDFVRSRYQLVYSEEHHTLADGSSRWMIGSASGAVVDGRLGGYWLCLRDTSDRKRADADRERRGRILEAVAFSSVRLLQPGTWRTHADEVLARLGHAAQAARAWIAQKEDGPDDSASIVYRFSWGEPQVNAGLDDLYVRGGWSLKVAGLERLVGELRAGRPVVTTIRELSEAERSLLGKMGTKAFAAVPVFSNGQWWGVLGLGEIRYEREWSAPEVEGLKAAAAVLGAAIERERADVALRESEERFSRLSAAAFEGIAVTEAGVFVDANEQLARMMGWSVPDIVGRSVLEFVAPEDQEKVTTYLLTASEEPYQHLARRRDGSVFPVEIRARSLPRGDRTVRVSAVRDVSARVQAEERQSRLEADLRQAADEWRQTFDALDLGILLADAEGRIVRLNRGALELAASDAFHDLVGRRLDELSHHEPWRTVLKVHREVGETRTTVTYEAREGSNGRSFYFLGSPWFRGTGRSPGCVLTFRDVTDFTNMQNQLRRARTMEALGSLVAGVAHEVRNPLFSISATVDALESELDPRPEFAQYAHLLRSQVDRMSQLMRDLLDYGRPSVLRRGSTRLADVVRRAVRSCAALAREREVRVEEDLAPDLPALEIDGARVEQALENLLANAIQHAPVGSAVRLGGCLDTSGREPRVRCTVEDEGPGLPAESLERIFEPFFSQRKGGTGLGLPIVQRVAEAHGGEVSAENRPEAGARFTLFLPVGGVTLRSGGGRDA